MARFIGFIILGGVFLGLFFLIRDFLDNPTASERELATPAGQFKAGLTTATAPARPRTETTADLLRSETRGFRVTSVIIHRERVFYHQSEREPDGLPRVLRIPEKAYLVAEGERSRQPVAFEVDPEIARRTAVGFVIPLSRAQTLKIAQTIAEPQPPPGFGTSLPRNAGGL